MNIAEIDAMAEALAKQCGMRCSVNKSWEGDRLVMAYVQVCLRPGADSDDASAWQFYMAWNHDELVSIRDQMVAFIAEHRRAAA